MTVTDEVQEVNVESESSEGTENTTTSEDESKGKAGRNPDRDFTKHNEMHAEIAEYVNAHSGLDPVTPYQVKAVLLLRADFANSPEQIAKRDQLKAQREAEAKEFEGLTPEEIKVIKAARRAQENAAKMEARAAEALARAKALRESHEASGEDLAAAVNQAQNGTEAETEAEAEAPTGKRRGLRR